VRREGWRALLVGLTAGLAAAGCAKRFQRLDLAALRASQPRTMIVAQARSPVIISDGPPESEIWFRGLVGAIQYQTANQRRAGWMKRCEIDDPVDEIRDTVPENLAEALSIEVLESERKTKATSPEGIINDHPGADLIVDIRTSRWGITSVPPKNPRSPLPIRFASFYQGSLTLIDARKGAVIAEASCAIQFSNGDDPPTLNELFEDDCALLRKGITLSAQTCSKLYRTRLLGVD
jgi:hypothetical protein